MSNLVIAKLLLQEIDKQVPSEWGWALEKRIHPPSFEITLFWSDQGVSYRAHWAVDSFEFELHNAPGIFAQWAVSNAVGNMKQKIGEHKRAEQCL